jgi:glyoxylate reductase
MKPRVFVTRRIPDEGLVMIRGEAEMRIWEEEMPPPRAALLEECREAEGLLSLLTDRIDAELMDSSPRLRVISNYAVGFDNVDIDAATRRGIPVGNTPGVLTDTTADFAFALLMTSARRIVEGVDYVRGGQWKTWGPMLLTGPDIHHSTLGIVGFGRIGQAMAWRAIGFDMRVLYCSSKRRPDLEESMGVRCVDMDTLLSNSDFISIHTSLSERTRHLFNRGAFARMKPSAIIINTARGPVIDPEALYEALAAGRIRGAALDVTEPEPIPLDSRLLNLPNCIIVPHLASASLATRAKMAEMAAANLVAGLRGENLPTCVNLRVYDQCLRQIPGGDRPGTVLS